MIFGYTCPHILYVVHVHLSVYNLLYLSICLELCLLLFVSLLSRVWLFGTPWTVACQAPLSMAFSRQEHWSGLPCPSPGHLPNPGIEPASLVSCIGRQILLPLCPLGSSIVFVWIYLRICHWIRLFLQAVASDRWNSTPPFNNHKMILQTWNDDSIYLGITVVIMRWAFLWTQSQEFGTK